MSTYEQNMNRYEPSIAPFVFLAMAIIFSVIFFLDTKNVQENIPADNPSPVQQEIYIAPEPVKMDIAAIVNDYQKLIPSNTTSNGETLYAINNSLPPLHYKTLPMPKDNTWEEYKPMLVMAATYANISATEMVVYVAVESQFVTTATPDTSKAAGICQFIPSTWNKTTSRYGKQYGVSPKTSRIDPRANALMCAEYLKENETYLTTSLQRGIQPTELYLAHLLGANGAVSIIKANPSALARDIRPAAAKANVNLFYKKTKAGYVPRTVAEFKANIRNKLKTERDLYQQETESYVSITVREQPKEGIVLNYQFVKNNLI